ncbi:inovirus-type Gp2 protein [Citrobacter freundii]|uniref:YagK/YfjJ domain-containing protein n=1 Tax=Citrobacter freundii TaxID=546 RepID=UPI0024E16242|nr:inovirus-type Gp2 protein [Citrobacter freundii]EKV5092619.1 inovirus-type Gp2 protein [Citrobacter freundii]ELN4556642.1 inovirus-type Gp2 protein [Citrobacter freundii]MDT7261833.1 inovirus-type Gp2 protein [Citrobacter freundii]WOR59851.1 inovirus-type Gp2 protein [Citrobacter freundii]HBM8272638.1 inovirus-type Gp2 protein [Citrobacter freundii]
MNHSYTRASDAAGADAISTRAFLQRAVDHYPRLVAFSFTMLLPNSETMADNRTLILRFHTEVWQRIGEYSCQRQQTRRHSPPTILRWIWESVCTAECRMVLLMNLDTLGAVSDDEGAQQVMSKLLCEAWLIVSEVHCGITDIMPIIVNRSDSGTAMTPFNQLKTQLQSMVTPVLIARTGAICP